MISASGDRLSTGINYDRIFCLGDSITLGCNDSLWLGRPGRDLMPKGRSLAVWAAFSIGASATRLCGLARVGIQLYLVQLHLQRL